MLRLLARGLAGLLLAVTGICASAQAQTYPNHAITMIVPFGAGSSADLLGRYIGQFLGQALGQSIVIQDRPGAGGVVGASYAAGLPPDGYTLMLTSNAMTANETLYAGKKSYDLLRDFVPVATLCNFDFLLVVNPAVPAKNLADFIKLAKSEPGKMSYASAGNGTSNHLAAELFKSLAGIDVVHIPYKSSDEARTDVLADREQMYFDTLSALLEYVKDGQLRPLAIAGKQRAAQLPDVPTFAESGFPSFEATLWVGILAPKGTPAAIVDRLNGEIGKILTRPDVVANLAKQGTLPFIDTPAQFGQFLKEDVAKWGHIVKISGAKID